MINCTVARLQPHIEIYPVGNLSHWLSCPFKVQCMPVWGFVPGFLSVRSPGNTYGDAPPPLSPRRWRLWLTSLLSAFLCLLASSVVSVLFVSCSIVQSKLSLVFIFVTHYARNSRFIVIVHVTFLWMRKWVQKFAIVSLCFCVEEVIRAFKKCEF